MTELSHIDEFCSKLDDGDPFARAILGQIVQYQVLTGTPASQIVITLALLVEKGLVGGKLSNFYLVHGEDVERLITALVTSSFEKLMPGLEAKILDSVKTGASDAS